MISGSTIRISSLGKTWLFDIDGTIVKHNGYKIDGKDSLIEGIKELLEGIPKEDKIILLTSRTMEYKELTEQFLLENRIRYDHVIYQLPYGERILINDRKPSGLPMAVAINTNRDEIMDVKFEIDYNI